MKSIHSMKIKDIKIGDMESLLVDSLSHASQEHVLAALKQTFKYALKHDIIEKDYSKFITIKKEDDSEKGIPFTRAEIDLMWENINIPFVDTILMLIYTGWRINELGLMDKNNIDLNEWTMRGGLKTKSGINRIVPIHSRIQGLVYKRYKVDSDSLIYNDFNKTLTSATYRVKFKTVMKRLNLSTTHTPHDCRHTFISLLDSANANRVSVQKLVGHAGSNLDEKIYIHKTLDELRKTIELIK